MSTQIHTTSPRQVRIKAIPSMPDYGAGEDGVIYRLTRPRSGPNRNRDLPYPLPSWSDDEGYLHVILFPLGERRKCLVSRLVLEAFVGPPESVALVAAHNDGNNTDNRPSNLRWATQQSNIDDREKHGNTAKGERSSMAKLTLEQVIEIRARASKYFGARLPNGVRIALAKEFGVCGNSIRKVIRHEVWGHVA